MARPGPASYDLPMTTTDRYLARGPRVGIRPFTADDREEFTALARESAPLHRPWLFPPDQDAAATTAIWPSSRNRCAKAC